MSFNALDVPAYRIPPKSQWPKTACMRTKFGQKVLWWERVDGGYHLPRDALEPYRLIGDCSVDGILNQLEEAGSPLGPGDDLLAMMEQSQQIAASSRSKVEDDMVSFLERYSKLPEWVNKDQLRRGQEVFLAYLPAASLSLYYRSLVAGFSIPKIAAVIRATAYLSPPSRPDQVLQRLLDTGELTAACTGLGLESILPGGIGWRTALYVRFLHAKVRFKLLQRTSEKKWDVKTYGIPINQEDMAATLLAFSVNVLFGIDLISGVTLPEQQKLDYLALWRYLGWLLGVETEIDERLKGQPTRKELPPLDPCGPGVNCVTPNPIMNSNSILQSVIFHLLEPDESSVEIARHLLTVTDRKPPSTSYKKIPVEFYENEVFYYRCFNCRKMIGDPLADALDLPLHPNALIRFKIQMKSAFFLSLFRVYTAAAIWFKPMRSFAISWHAQAMTSFHESWNKSHKSKLARALARGEKSSVLDDEESLKSQSLTSLCPFAMTAEPIV
jgi:hypothetical protein